MRALRRDVRRSATARAVAVAVFVAGVAGSLGCGDEAERAASVDSDVAIDTGFDAVPDLDGSGDPDAGGEKRFRADSVAPRTFSARGGAHIVLSGDGFGPATVVAVRGVQATIVARGPTEITFVAPAMVAGPADVGVTDGAQEALLPAALEAMPLELQFTAAPPFRVPALPPRVYQLRAADLDADGGADLIAATDDGPWILRATGPATWTAEPLLGTESPEGSGVGEGSGEGSGLGEGSGSGADATGGDGVPTRDIAWFPGERVVIACRDNAFRPIDAWRREASTWRYVRGPDAAPAACRALLPLDPSGSAAAGLLAWMDGADGDFVRRIDWSASAGIVVSPELEPPGQAPPVVVPPGTASLVLADVDGEPGVDVVAVGAVDGVGFVVQLQWGEGGATRRDILGADTLGPVAAAVGFDADRDGDTDLLLATDGSDALWVNDGTGRFFDDTFSALPFDRAEGTAVAVGDLDWDGWDDLVIATVGAADRLYRNAGGRFDDRTSDFALSPRDSHAVVLVDVDADGDVDVVSVDGATGEVRLDALTEPSAEVP